MLIYAITYEFKPEDADEAERLFKQLRDASLTEPGCHAFDVARSNQSGHIFVLYEKWNDQAALDEHAKSPHFVQFGINGIRKLATSRTAHLCHPI